MDGRSELLAAIKAADRGPTEAELLRAPTLDHWRIELWEDHFRIYGGCLDHPEIEDDNVTTSPLIALNAKENWVRSRSRWYKLGPNFHSPEPPDRTEEFLRKVEHVLEAERARLSAGLDKIAQNSAE